MIKMLIRQAYVAIVVFAIASLLVRAILFLVLGV